MASNNPSASNSTPALYESGLTIPSDSENYSMNPDISASTSSDSPLILYKPSVTVWSIIRGAAINLVLPFVNGLMLGFGELFAHEAAFRLGWSGTKIFPTYRRSRPVAAGLGL
ncbi:outer membrane protein TOM13-domain-containing protein [Aspergillus egyptiacus]|nr:outer membrane protein TOM13-domain-containing protein [Aspergillus egyptiacus]